MGMLMKDVSYLLKLAGRCQDLEKTAIAPEVVKQLRIWATELAGMAEDSESRPSLRYPCRRLGRARVGIRPRLRSGG